MRDIRIGGRRLGTGPPYLIAEAGVNHNGDMGLARALVEIAAEAGADAIKFQLFAASSLVRPGAPTAEYQRTAEGHDQFALLEALELRHRDYEELAGLAGELSIDFLCTPFSIDAARFLVEALDVPAIKVSSGDLTFSALLRYLESTGRPVLASTGMATIPEIRLALRDLDGADVVLLHCVSQYPAPVADANVRALDELRLLTGDPVGFSDHFVELAPSIVAVACGARVVERHFTADPALPGPDQATSMSPDQLRAWVREVHAASLSLGSRAKGPQDSEEDVRLVARRSLVYAADLSPGDRLGPSHLDALRPADGISPQAIDEFVGRQLARSVKAGELARYEDLDD